MAIPRNLANFANKLETGGFTDGSVGTPSITFSSDTNTGIYRVGADQIASTAGGVGWITSKYTLGNIPATDNGVANTEQQFMSIGKSPQVLDQSGTATIFNIDTEDNNLLITRVPYCVKITGGGRPDNTGYNAPTENGLLALIPQTWGGNNVSGRNTLYVKNNPPYFMVKSTGVYVYSTHYALGVGIDSLVKPDDPNGGGAPVAIMGRVDNSNGANDNSAPICLLLDNGPTDNISKINGGQSLAISYDRRSGSTSRNSWVFYRNTTSNAVGSISTTNTTCSFTSLSDYRAKENVAPLTGALGRVSQLKPVTFNWKVDGSSGEGFIAHELQAVVPQAVTGNKDDVEEIKDGEGNVTGTKPKYQSVDTSFLVATLTAAIQELKAEVDALKAKVG